MVFHLDEVWQWFEDHPLPRKPMILAGVAAAETVLPLLRGLEPATRVAQQALRATESWAASEAPEAADAAIRATVELVGLVHTPGAWEIIGSGALLPGAWGPDADAIPPEKAAVLAVRHAAKAVQGKNRDAARHAAAFAVLAFGRQPSQRAKAWATLVRPALEAVVSAK